MCGITGIYHRDERPVDGHVLASMTRIISHRGPDDEGIWSEGGIGFGHRRLSIRDLSPAGKQPFFDSTGKVTVVFNGEIYNYQQLRIELEHAGRPFSTTCDTELIPNGYLQWGMEVFNRLEGIFAIALWDSRTNDLFLARDGMGVKPLFYSDDGVNLRFGSEIKALLADPGQSRRISREALHTFLALGYAGPDSTLLNGVKQVPPGTIIKFNQSGVEQSKFWQPERRGTFKNLHEAKEAFTPIWDNVIKEQMSSDVSLCVLQSGGIDSTLISVSASKHSNSTLFTACFNEATHDEGGMASLVASCLHAPHNKIYIDDPADMSNLFRKVVYHFDGQVADSSGFAFYRLAGEVSRHAKVVLSGDGADELFAGYNTYLASLLATRVVPPLPLGMLSALSRLFSTLGKRVEKRLPVQDVLSRLCAGLAVRPRINSHASWRRVLPACEIESLYAAGLNDVSHVNPLNGYISALGSTRADVLDRCLIADQTYYLPSDLLMKVDAMSMAHGLEVRVPFLDRRVVEFAASLDKKLLISLCGTSKYFLRSLLADCNNLAPVSRGAKRGLQIPLAGMLRTSLKGLANNFDDRWLMLLAPFFQPDRVRGLWVEHLSGRRNHAYVLWALMTLAVWIEDAGISTE